MSIITIVGAGMMGSAIGIPAADNGHTVRLVGTPLDREIIDHARETGFHMTMKRQLPESYTYYKFDGSALTPFGSVIHDGNASPNAPWFVSQDGDMDITNDIPATQEQAQGIIAQYEALYISFPLTPFSALA